MAVRALMRERLRNAHLARDEHSTRICEAIRRESAWLQARTVALFAPQPHEPDVERLWNAIENRTFCYPRVQDVGLEFLRIDHPTALVLSRWNLREPEFLRERAVDLSAIDLLLVPGVAFTRRGDRLGRGGGFYDRVLARPELRATTIGVCFELQISEELPIESHDARVHLVITEATAAESGQTAEPAAREEPSE